MRWWMSRETWCLMETRRTRSRAFIHHIKPAVANPTCLFHLASHPWQYDEREHKQKPFSKFRKPGLRFPPGRANSRWIWIEIKDWVLPWPLHASSLADWLIPDWVFFPPTDPSLFIRARITRWPLRSSSAGSIYPWRVGWLALRSSAQHDVLLHYLILPSAIIICLSGAGGYHFLLSIRLNCCLLSLHLCLSGRFAPVDAEKKRSSWRDRILSS